MNNATPVMSLEHQFHDFRETLPAIVQTLACGAVATDSNGIVVYANQWLCGRLSYGRRELIGHPVARIFDRDAVEELRSHLAGERFPRPYPTRAIRRDTGLVPVLAVPQPLRDQHGRCVGLFLLLIDGGDVKNATQLEAPRGWRQELAVTAQQVAARDEALSDMPDDPRQVTHPELQSLSAREWDVVKRLVSGLRAPAIARELGISVHTVRNHLKSCYRKLDVHNQSDLIDYIRRLMAT